MTLHLSVGGNTNHAVIDTLRITKEISGRNTTATFTVINIDLSIAFPQMAEVIITNANTGVKMFRGFITTVTISQKSGSVQTLSVSCIGLEYLLENVTVNRTWVQQTDRTIIQDAFNAVLPEITTDNSTVAVLATDLLDFEAKDISLTNLLINLAGLTNGEFRVTEEKQLSWRAAGSVLAPFGFSDNPTFM